ncbi:MAG: hypothetical protein PF692_12665 [Kiritimatiellae bacterium]|jgi:hypothetical protein|nr:hypothetical protein [Kiritimatiellia bacterium]
MKKIFNILAALAVMTSVACAKDVLESNVPLDDDVEILNRSGAIRPFQFSIVEDIQLIPKEKSITGLKLNLVYGYNYDINGLDIGIISKGKNVNALQVNLMSIVETEGQGLQVGLFNLVRSYSGMQWGVFNLCGTEFTGCQAGFYNYAPTCTGLQLGIVNTCSSMRGVQIGLVNIIKENPLPFMPIINMRF